MSPFVYSLFLGMLAGLLSDVQMTLFEAPFYRRYGIRGAVEWQLNEIVTSYLLGEEYHEDRRLKIALLMHLFHGTIFGGITALVVATVLQPVIAFTWLVGLIASITLWFIVPFLSRSVFECRFFLASLLS